MNYNSKKRKLVKWCFWFALGNTILLCLLSLKYFSAISWFNSSYLTTTNLVLIKAFAVFLTIGYLGLLGLLFTSILVLIVHAKPNRILIFSSSITTLLGIATLFIIDIYAYRLFHFHLNGILFDLIINTSNNDLFDLSKQEIVFAIVVIFCLIVFEISYAIIIWRYLTNKKWLASLAVWIITIIGLSFYTSYAMLIYSYGHPLSRVMIDIARALPLCTDLFGPLLFGGNDTQQIDRLDAENYIHVTPIDLKLNYPLKPIHCLPPKKPHNILVIVIDSWRFDTHTAAVTPAIFEFSNKSWQFTQHYSGGNSTGPGIFSLFYALPSLYWGSMESYHRSPLFIDELVKQGYQLGIFASAPLDLPSFNKTVFSSIKNLPINTPGLNPYERDRTITKKFKKFIVDSRAQTKPFFSFLFYDAVHGFCAFENNSLPFKPSVTHCNRSTLTATSDPAPYFNRYKNALLLVDNQIKEILELLKIEHILDDTLIVITSDHGEEFNDHHSGFWGHASNYSEHQTHVPLIIHWPGNQPQMFTHTTSHYDVIPTLMKYNLGCDTEFSNYSLGHELLDEKIRPFLLIGSYIDFAIKENNQTTRVLRTGNYLIQTAENETIPNAKLNTAIMNQAFFDLRRFYLNSKTKKS